MNRRGFLRALAAAPVAAIIAPVAFAKPDVLGGEIAASVDVYPVYAWSQARRLNKTAWLQLNPARVMQQQFNEMIGASEESDRRFDEMAAYCDEPVEADLGHAPPAAS